jgi:hypothetical protein
MKLQICGFWGQASLDQLKLQRTASARPFAANRNRANSLTKTQNTLNGQNRPETRANAGSTSILLHLFHRLLLLSFRVFFLLGLAFVVLLLALRKPDLKFDAPTFVVQV